MPESLENPETQTGTTAETREPRETESPDAETPITAEGRQEAAMSIEAGIPVEEGVPVEDGEAIEAGVPMEAGVPVEEILSPAEETSAPESVEDTRLSAILEALVYIADEPLTLKQIAGALQQPADRIRTLLEQLIQEYEKASHGITIRELAGGYKMATKPEHHEAVRAFVKSLSPALKLSLPALETLAMIAYKQPITGPEIMDIRGVQGAGVIKTLLDRKLIAVAGRKNVVGKPILYKTTKEFLIQFGLKDLNELPSVKELDEIQRMALSEPERLAGAAESGTAGPDAEAAPEGVAEAAPAPSSMEAPDPEKTGGEES